MRELIDAVEDIAYPDDADASVIAAISQAASLKRIADAIEALSAKGLPTGGGNPLLRRSSPPAPPKLSVAPDADGFVPWPGRVKPPIDGADEVIVRLRDGSILQRFAQQLRWLHGSQVASTNAQGQLEYGEDTPGDIVGWQAVPKDPAHSMR